MSFEGFGHSGPITGLNPSSVSTSTFSVICRQITEVLYFEMKNISSYHN
jgi:hypothetical protein